MVVIGFDCHNKRDYGWVVLPREPFAAMRAWEFLVKATWYWLLQHEELRIYYAFKTLFKTEVELR